MWNVFLQYLEDGGRRGESQLGSVHWVMGMARRSLSGEDEEWVAKGALAYVRQVSMGLGAGYHVLLGLGAGISLNIGSVLVMRRCAPRRGPDVLASNGGGRSRAGVMYSEQPDDVLLAERPTCAEPVTALLAPGLERCWGSGGEARRR